MGKGMGLAALKVLRAIAGGAAFGLDIIAATGLPSGTVYPALSRHERDGYLRSSWEDDTIARRHRRPARRYYRITAEGRRAIEAEMSALSASWSPAKGQRVKG